MELEQITRDHSLMQELIDRGFYTPEQARNSLNKNLVTRAIGIDDNVQIDIQEDIAMTGDIYLLCSDGVTDMIEDHLIKSVIWIMRMIWKKQQRKSSVWLMNMVEKIIFLPCW